MTNEKRGGLTLPTGSASQALQELLKDERQPAPDEPASIPQPAEELSRSASNEVLKEGIQDALKPSVNPRSRGGRKEPARASSNKPWWEGVKTRAKTGSSERRRVRLNVDVDEDVHLRMKIWCVKNGYKFNEMVPALLAAFLDEAGE
jgi:hypothetical protein